MALKLTSITLNTAHLENMLSFYRILGVVFAETKVDKGSHVCRATIQGCEFSLYAAHNMQKNIRPILQMSFAVDELESKITRLCQVPGVVCIMDSTEMPDGKKAILLDPDGHSVELKQSC